MKPNFPINTGRQGIPVDVVAGGVVVSLLGSAGDMRTRLAPDVLIDNPGPYDVHVAAGDDVDRLRATTRGLRVPAGSMQPFGKGATSALAFVLADSVPSGNSQRVVVHIGTGA